MLARAKRQPKRNLDYQERVIRICFDSQSISKITPGLKMIYALDDPPLFVTVRDEKVQMLKPSGS